MADIYLLIPDAPFRGAVTEQLTLAALGTVASGSDLAAALEAENVAAIILDEAALDKKNLKLLRDAAATRLKPVFALGDNDTMHGDENGLTESFPKPLRLGHLMARLHFYLQVAPRLRAAPVRFGPYRFEPQSRQITRDGGEPIRLTEKETALLEYLGQSESAVPRDELLAAIWGYDARIDTHTLETHIYQLRRKLDPQQTGANWLVNEQGSYRLQRDESGKSNP